MSDRSAPIYLLAIEGPDGVEIRIEPEGLGSDLRRAIERLRWHDADDGASTLQVELDNASLALLDSPLLVPGNVVRFQLGYPGRLTPRLAYSVRSLRGGRRLTMECVDRTAKLSETIWSRGFDNVTPTDVVRRIATEEGITDLVMDESPPKQAHIHQADETNAAFFQRLARERGFIFKLEGQRLRFHRPDLAAKPVRDIVWFEGGEVQDFSVDADWLAIPGAAVARGVDARRKEVFDEKVEPADVQRPALAPVSWFTYDRGTKDFVKVEERKGESGMVIGTASASSRIEAVEQAEASFESAERGQFKMDVTLGPGDPALRSGLLVNLVNFGRLLSGPYYIQAAEHEMGSGGYTTRLSLQRNGVGRTATQAPETEGGEMNEKAATAAETPKVFKSFDRDTQSFVLVQSR